MLTTTRGIYEGLDGGQFTRSKPRGSIAVIRLLSGDITYVP